MKIVSVLFLFAFVSLLLGCETMVPKPGDTAEYLPAAPPQPLPQAFNNGAIFQPAQSLVLFEDYKARRVGDLLTVVLVERTNARKTARTAVSKDSEIDISLDRVDVFGRSAIPRGPLGIGASGSRDFTGSGNSAQSNQLDGQITVTVAEVYPNGNLLVQGEKWLGINQGKEYVRLRGIVRPVDIRADNSVLSTQIGNAQVHYGGTGAVADSNVMGWLSRFFISAFVPF